MYDDYTEITPGALERLEKRLESYFHEILIEPIDTPTGNPTSTTGGSSTSMNPMRGLMEGLRGSTKGSNLPQHQQPGGTTALYQNICSTTSGASRRNHNFIMLCVPYMNTVKLEQPDSCQIKTDENFFRALGDYYMTLRKNVSRLKRFNFLRKVQQIHFVQVGST